LRPQRGQARGPSRLRDSLTRSAAGERSSFVGGLAPLAIGGLAGAICVFALAIKAKTDCDDSLDVIAVHLLSGLVGTLRLGLFADSAVNDDVDGRCSAAANS
jgi:ammonia channel protein AmtB